MGKDGRRVCGDRDRRRADDASGINSWLAPITRYLAPTMLIAVAAAFADTISPASAAQITCVRPASEPQSCSGILIQGGIVKGDLQRLETALDPERHRQRRPFEQPDSRSTTGTNTVYLHSRGGDVLEAMAMGRLIRRLHLTTVAPQRWGANLSLGVLSLMEGPARDWTEACRGPECGCASACFLVWAGGIKREGDLLLVHRPRASSAMVAELGVADTRAALIEVRRRVEDFLRDMEVPPTAIAQMMDTEPTSLTSLLMRREDARDHGFIPSIVDSLTEMCRIPSLSESRELVRLERQVMALQDSRQPVPQHLRDGYRDLNVRDIEAVRCIWRSIAVDAVTAKSMWQTEGRVARLEAQFQREREDAHRRCEIRDRERGGQPEADVDFDYVDVPGVGPVQLHRSLCIHGLTNGEREQLFQRVRDEAAQRSQRTVNDSRAPRVDVGTNPARVLIETVGTVYIGGELRKLPNDQIGRIVDIVVQRVRGFRTSGTVSLSSGEVLPWSIAQ